MSRHLPAFARVVHCAGGDTTVATTQFRCEARPIWLAHAGIAANLSIAEALDWCAALKAAVEHYESEVAKPEALGRPFA